MNKYITNNLVMFFMFCGILSPCLGNTVDKSDAAQVAENWITTILHLKGSWGQSPEASVSEVRELVQDSKSIGYYCGVDPVGYIIAPKVSGLAPVKAYSTTCNLDPEATHGLSHMIKDRMSNALNVIESRLGSVDSVSTAQIKSLLQSDHSDAWNQLTQPASAFNAAIASEVILMNYEGGDPPLLSSAWEQKEPYNDQCPSMGCSWTCGSNTNALVGCVATAGAQIIRYWAWPPYGIGSPYNDDYNWDIPDSFSGCSWNSLQVNNVAEICYEAGLAAGMDYGCDTSSAWVGDCPACADMEDAFVDKFRYHSNLNFDQRWNDSDASWHNKILDDLSQNRPLQYAISSPLHSMVIDGWEVAGDIFFCHINYGGAVPNTGWYNIDNLDQGTEGMIKGIRPNVSLGPSVSGTYSKQSFPYRYFDQDCTGQNAVFSAGQNIQFLSGVSVLSTGTAGNHIEFTGTTTENTRLFSIDGTATGGTTAGIVINNGSIQLYNDGSIRFHE